MNLKLLSIVLLLFVLNTSAQNQSFYKTLDTIQKLRELSDDTTLNLKERLVHAQNASALSHETRVDSTMLLSEKKISSLYLKLYDLESHKRSRLKMLKLAQKLNDSLETALSNSLLGWNYQVSGIHNDSAFYYYHKAKEIFNKLDDPVNEIDVLLNIAILQDEEEDFVSAEINLIQALDLLKVLPETENNLESKYMAYNSLGLISNEMSSFDKALAYYNKAIVMSDKMENNYSSNLFININIAELYKNQKEFKKSIAIYQRLLKDKSIYKKDPITYAAILNNLAHTRFLAKDSDHQDLMTLFKQAYKISDSLNYPYEISAVGNDMSEFYLSLNNKDSALHYLDRSLNISRKAKVNTEVLRSLKLLSKAKDGEVGKTYLYEYISLNDSILAKQRSMRNKFARIQFETDEITAENEVLTKDRRLLFITIIALIISLMLLYFNFRQRSKNKALLFESEQQKANENIYALMLDQQTKLERSRIEERFRISENLHDGVLGKLFGVRTSFGYLGTQLTGNDDTLKKYDDCLKNMQAIEKEIRDVSHELNEDILTARTNFESIIDYYIKELSELHAFDYKIQSEGNIPWATIDDGLKVNLYRLVQESVLNMIKHAEADNIEFNFTFQENTLILSIKDDGIGFDIKQQHKGIGLKNMQSRAKQLKGELSIHSIPNHGTTITVMMPI